MLQVYAIKIGGRPVPSEMPDICNRIPIFLRGLHKAKPENSYFHFDA